MLHGKNSLFPTSKSALRVGVVAFSVAQYMAIYCLFVTWGFAQELLPLFEQPKTLPINGVQFGMDKIANTFVFIGNADISTRVESGEFRLVNVYRGSAFRTLSTAIRDDQGLYMSYILHPERPLSAFIRQSWIANVDSRSVGLSSLQRLNGAIGLAYKPNYDLSAEVFGGVEQTTQLGVSAFGPLAAAQIVLNRAEIEQWDVSGRALWDWHKIDDLRTNSDLDVSAGVSKNLIEGSSFSLSSNFAQLGRSFLTTLPGVQSALAVESRAEDRLMVSGDLLYSLSERWSISGRGSVQSSKIGRQYNEGLAAVPITAVARQLTELILDVEGALQYAYGPRTLSVGASLYRRTEQNSVAELFQIEPQDLEAIKQQEVQRDNGAVRSRFFAKGFLPFGDHDTLRADWSWWLLQYNTPSALNDDDRDELSALASVTYSKGLSSTLSVGLRAAYQFGHIVFLKASRSSLNNQNTVIRLSPFVRINGSVVVMQPHLEVLANYTVYDFEGQGASVRSFSFRQISYRDSMRIFLTERLRGEAQVLVRYFERGTLLWQDFAEIPQASNLEYLVKLMGFTTIGASARDAALGTRAFQSSAHWDVGFGLRLYQLDQHSLQIFPGLPSLINSVRFWAPETAIRYQTNGGSTLTLSGWYEFQTVNVVGYRELPNILLQANVAF